MSGNAIDSDQLQLELYRAMQASWFRAAKIIAVLTKISQSNDIDFIRNVIPLFWEKDKTVVFEAAATISLLIQRVPTRKLPELDLRIRERWPYGFNLNGLQIKHLKCSSSWWWAFAVLASHPSGYVRQAALEELVHEDLGESLPFVLLRTNDWVEPVRNVARNLFKQRLLTVAALQLNQCLPLVFRMRNYLRHQPLELFQEIEKSIASRTEDLSIDAYGDNSPSFFHYRFKLAKHHSHIPLDRLISTAAIHPDTALRVLACDWLSESTTSQEIRDKFGRLLLTDKSPLVRTRAFWRIANTDPEKYQPEIEHALMDPSAATQDTARGAWKILLKKEALSFYRAKITEARLASTIVSAIRGLRAESNLEDEALIRPFLKNASVKVRKEALRTLVSWNAADLITLLHEGLQSSSPSYSKEAATLLINRQRLLSSSLIKELLLHPQHLNSHRVALWLLKEIPKWSSLPLILLAYSIPSCQDRALIAFGNWNKSFNRVQSMPTKEEAAEIIKVFSTIAETPLSKNRELIFVISNIEQIK